MLLFVRNRNSQKIFLKTIKKVLFGWKEQHSMYSDISKWSISELGNKNSPAQATAVPMAIVVWAPQVHKGVHKPGCTVPSWRPCSFPSWKGNETLGKGHGMAWDKAVTLISPMWASTLHWVAKVQFLAFFGSTPNEMFWFLGHFDFQGKKKKPKKHF